MEKVKNYAILKIPYADILYIEELMSKQEEKGVLIPGAKPTLEMLQRYLKDKNLTTYPERSKEMQLDY